MEKRQEVKYGLKHKKSNTVLGYTKDSNEGASFCVENTTRLCLCDNMWLVKDALNAAYVRQFSTQWYNAGYKTPFHEFDAKELEVVKVVIELTIESDDTKVPTFKEYMMLKYKVELPEHYNYVMKNFNKDDNYYSLYDLENLKRDGKI